MLKTEDIKIVFRGDLGLNYKDILDRLFFFNQNQHIYENRINRAIEEFSVPVLKESAGKVSVRFQNEEIGQTLHIMDSKNEDASLIGVVMYVRESKDMITVVHMAIHEKCESIFKQTGINIALIVFEELIAIFGKIKGVNKIRIYYTDKVIKI